MLKRYRIALMVLLICLLGIAIYAGVQKKEIRQQMYKFDLKAGDRIIIIDTKTYGIVRTTIRPMEARTFDYKVPEGKTLSGVLNLK